MIVYYILTILLLVPALSLFVRKCFGSGMIFRRYYVLLNYLWIKMRRGKTRKYRSILKPLGLCPYCYNTWLTILFWTLLPFGLSSAVTLLPLLLGGSYIMLELYMKLVVSHS